MVVSVPADPIGYPQDLRSLAYCPYEAHSEPGAAYVMKHHAVAGSRISRIFFISTF